MFWSQYKSLLLKRPLATKAITSAILMATSDSLCQLYELEDKREVSSIPLTDSTSSSSILLATSPSDCKQQQQQEQFFSWQRTFHVAITGLTLSGPISHVWYNSLERCVVHWGLHRRVALALGVKLVLDALLFTPVAVAGYFVWRQALLWPSKQQQQQQESMALLPFSTWVQAVQASWSFWPMANVVNFTLVPTPFRVLFNNSFSLVWNSYLSHLHSTQHSLRAIE